MFLHLSLSHNRQQGLTPGSKTTTGRPDRQTDSQLFLQEVLARLAGLGLALSCQLLALCRHLQAEAGGGLVQQLGHVLLQKLHLI